MTGKNFFRLFKRVISKKGSVLFIVLILMSVLIILASAVYYAVLADRDTVFTTYSDVQAYETAQNINTLLQQTFYYEVLGEDGAEPPLFYDLTLKAESLEVPPSDDKEEWEEGVHYLKAEYDLADLEDDYGGSGKVTIYIYLTEITDENGETSTAVVFETTIDYGSGTVTTKSAANTSDTFTEFISYEGFPGFTKAFASTGYGTADSYFNADVTVDVFYDTEYTYLSKGNATPNFRGNITAVGSLEIAYAKWVKGSGGYDQELTVGKNFIVRGSDGTELNTGGIVRVAGDMIIKDNSNFRDANTRYYILGDLILQAGGVIDLNGSFYVAGNIVVHSGSRAQGNYTLYTDEKSQVLLDTGVQNNAVSISGTKWPKSVTGVDGEALFYSENRDKSQDSTTAIIKEYCAESEFVKWGANKDISDSRTKNIWYANADGSKTNGGVTYVDDWNYSDSNFAASNGETFDGGKKWVYYINDDCKIGNIKSGGDQNNINCIVIDTGQGDNAKDITVRLDANLEDNVFSFKAGLGQTEKVAILTIGDGTVTLAVPDGVTFKLGGKYDVQSEKNVAVMPYNLAVEPGGKCWDSSGRTGRLLSDAARKGSEWETFLTGLVGTSEPNCTNSAHKQHEHNDTYTEAGTLVPDGEFGPSYNCRYCRLNMCEGEMNLLTNIGTAEFNAGRATNKQIDTRGEAEAINMGIFLVSDDKYAQMDFGAFGFFTGFIYAPYMTYYFVDENNNGLVVFGGMIVSDYVITAQGAFIGVKPDNDAIKRVTDGKEVIRSITTRTWRTFGK